MAHAYIFLTDMHTGSVVAPYRRGVLMGNASDKMRMYMHDCFDHCRTIWLPSVLGTMPYMVELCGDIIDGTSPKAQLVTDDEAEQQNAAVDLLRPWCDGATEVRGLKGTEWHTGKGAKWDGAVYRMLGVPQTADGDAARDDDWLEDGGMLCHVAHHMGTTNVPASVKTPMTREYNEAMRASFEHDYPKPNWIIRAHSHYYRLDEYGEGRTRVVSLPGWQAKTGYANRISRGAPFSLGVFLLVVDGDIVEPKVKLYEWAIPKPVRIAWEATQNQSSPTPTGSPLSEGGRTPQQTASGEQRKSWLKRIIRQRT